MKQVLQALGLSYEDKTLSKNDAYALCDDATAGVRILTFHRLHFEMGVDVETIKTLGKAEVSGFE